MNYPVNKGLWPCACGHTVPARTPAPAGGRMVAVLEYSAEYNKATRKTTLYKANSGRNRASINNLTNDKV